MNSKDVRAGVEEAMAYWLSEKSVTTPDCLIEGVRRAFGDWLKQNKEAVIQAIAEEVAKKHGEAPL